LIAATDKHEKFNSNHHNINVTLMAYRCSI
jgi:hypothetical protein